MPPDQRAHRVRRLCTFSEPVAHPLLVDLHEGRLRARVVVAEDFDERTVTGGTRIGDDDAEERPFLGTGSTQTNGDHVTLLKWRPGLDPECLVRCAVDGLLRSPLTGCRLEHRYRRLRSICVAWRRAFLPPPPSPAMPPSCFNIFCICTNCFNKRFTSSTDVPLPFAIRFRRLPLMMCCFRRSSTVIELMIASTREICLSSGLFSASAFMLLMPGIMPIIDSSGPIFRIVFS